jgi:hypothetical protein
MADLLILEFSTPEAVELYNQVNKLIGIDPTTNSGDWPEDMLSHQAGGEGERLFVVESWKSRGAQEEFMNTRLGPAFGEAHVPPPANVTWLPQVGTFHR